MPALPALSRKRLHLVALAGIVLLGGWLRFTQLDLMEFKRDEWRLHKLAATQARGEVQLHGIMSSVGLPNPPMTVYLFALPALLSADPVVMVGMTALLNTIAIALAYVLARKWASPWAALGATLLFAVAPRAVLASRAIWAQDLLPFFTVCFFLAAVGWVREGRLRHALVLGATFAMLHQIHYSSLALSPILLFLLWKRRSRRQLAFCAAGAVLYAALWTPFAVYVLQSERQPLRKHSIGREHHRARLDEMTDGLTWQARLMGRGSFEGITGQPPQPSNYWATVREWGSPIILAIALIAGLGVILGRIRQQPEYLLLLMWFLLPPVLLAFHRMLSHYLYICYPVTFIMVGILMDEVARIVRLRCSTHHARIAVLSVGVMLITLLSIDHVLFFTDFLKTTASDGGTLGDYGIAYRDKLRVATYLKDEIPQGDFLFDDYSHKQQTEDTYNYLYLLAGGTGTMTPLRLQREPAGVPLFAVLSKGAQGTLKLKQNYERVLTDAGTVQLGPLRVQKFLPIEHNAPNRAHPK